MQESATFMTPALYVKSKLITTNNMNLDTPAKINIYICKELYYIFFSFVLLRFVLSRLYEIIFEYS